MRSSRIWSEAQVVCGAMQMAECENWKSLIAILILISWDRVREESLDKFGLGQIESMEDPEIEPSHSSPKSQDHFVDTRLLHVAKMKNQERDSIPLRVTGCALLPWSSSPPLNHGWRVRSRHCVDIISFQNSNKVHLHYIIPRKPTRNAK